MKRTAWLIILMWATLLVWAQMDEIQELRGLADYYHASLQAVFRNCKALNAKETQ